MSARKTYASGQVELLVLLVLVLLFAVFASGGLLPKKLTPVSQGNTSTTVNSGGCCENAECDPTITDRFPFTNPITGRTIEYGLLKRAVILTEYNAWLEDSGKTTPDPENAPIILNRADALGSECGGGVKDQVWGTDNAQTACTPIPNDALIYVCKDKCGTTDRSFYRVCASNPPSVVPCYGEKDTVYDVYYSIPQYQEDGSVPPVIKNCSTTGSSPITKQVIVEPSPDPGKPNLQLKNFTIENVILQTDSAGWISPYCKPAIYLYPQKKTDVNVAIAPKGKLTLAIPSYPKEGWNVTAYPDGNIIDQQKSYDYLYYEAEIPNELIEKPKEGFVVTYEELTNLFDDLLPKLGLNEKESSQFSDYWLKALPRASYYFVGIVKMDNLNKIAPLTINPSPTTIIRVTLYFEALKESKTVATPTISPVTREGFTAVEWGGIVQTDPTHPFSCFM